MMIPEKFKERMKNMLGEDYPAFIRALEEGKNVRGMRVNTEKCSEDLFLTAFPYPTRKISYAKNGYILDSDAPVGNLAAHHAGIIYMQDPGAMASVSCLDIPKGAYVIDMCAAPGGKSGQAAALIGDEGFLLSNEYVPKRAKITVGNLNISVVVYHFSAVNIEILYN
jgi:16S rRNA C967 or C1407 C5-methylase (RsmB/RsmF family)